MGLNVEDAIAGLDPAERRKVEELAAEFISEEMTLRELRKACHLTQVSVARELGVGAARRAPAGPRRVRDPSRPGASRPRTRESAAR